MEDDFLKNLQEEQASKKRKKVDFNTGLEEVPAADVARATKGEVPKSLEAGNYIRRTVTLTDGQIEMTRRWADELGLSQYAMYRWLIDRGLTALEAGDRPETGYSVTPKEW